MARIPQPIELAIFKGAHKKDPQRYRKIIPKSSHPLGDAPDHMSEAAKKIWLELEQASMEGVLTGTDRWIMEITSEILAQYRRNPRGFSSSRLRTLISCLARIGMGPSVRQKLGISKKPK